MLCLLLVAIPVYGAAATLVGLLGVRHVHLSSAAAGAGTDPMAGWTDLRRAGYKPVAARVAHHHSAFERHRHMPADATVVALDGGAQTGDGDSGSAPAGSLTHVLALASVGPFTVPIQVDATGLEAAAGSASQWIADGPERPPKA